MQPITLRATTQFAIAGYPNVIHLFEYTFKYTLELADRVETACYNQPYYSRVNLVDGIHIHCIAR